MGTRGLQDRKEGEEERRRGAGKRKRWEVGGRGVWERVGRSQVREGRGEEENYGNGCVLQIEVGDAMIIGAETRKDIGPCPSRKKIYTNGLHPDRNRKHTQ